jgi:hypothetical protein
MTYHAILRTFVARRFSNKSNAGRFSLSFTYVHSGLSLLPDETCPSDIGNQPISASSIIKQRPEYLSP